MISGFSQNKHAGFGLKPFCLVVCYPLVKTNGNEGGTYLVFD